MKRPTLYSLVALALMAIAGVLITVPAGGADVPLRSSFEAMCVSGRECWIGRITNPDRNRPQELKPPASLRRCNL